MYTNRMSGLHAACVALQIHRSVEEAARYLTPRWNEGDVDGEMSGQQLAELLKASGLPCVVWVSDARNILQVAREAYCGHYTVLLRMRPQARAVDQTWGVYWGASGSEEMLVECVGPDGGAPIPRNLEDMLVGVAVVVEEEVLGPRAVLAFGGHYAN